MNKFAFVFLASLLAFPILSHADEGRFFQNLWSKFSGISNEAADLVADDKRNSRTTLETITFREPKYIRLLENARNVLGTSATADQFDQIESLRQENRQLEREIVELGRKRISAPAKSWNPLVETRSDIDKKLVEIPKEIEDNRARIADCRRQILQAYASEGVPVTEEELDYFLVSAEGSELVRLLNMAENMKHMQAVMERELEKDRGNVDMARMYAGMYLVSLEAYAKAQEAAIENISGYRQKLAILARDAGKNYEEARALQKNASVLDLPSLQSNLAINQKTMEVARLYDSLLQKRTDNLAKTRIDLGRRIDVARNTYKTVTNGASLIGLINQGWNDYSLLVNFKMPELSTIYDQAMLNAFADIAEKIKAE